jgi:formylglycine-generating enzyme required for sulfatase activity/class 3 adenylate cyclase
MDQQPPDASLHLNSMFSTDDPVCDMAIVFVDIVSYSQRSTRKQKEVIDVFNQCLHEAFKKAAEDHLTFLSPRRLHLPEDLVVLPLGDGAAIGFPFQGLERMLPLTFARRLFEAVALHEDTGPCPRFLEHGWCNVHSHFSLRCGASSGKVILFKDINGGYNIAGKPVNMAARVMNVANARQVFLTEEYFDELEQLATGLVNDCRHYGDIKIKHGLTISAYQYVPEFHGIDGSNRSDLTLLPSTRGCTNEITATSSLPTDKKNPLSNPIVKLVESEFVLVPKNEQIAPITSPSMCVRSIAIPFLIGKYAITQGLYRSVMGFNPSHFPGDRRPIETVSWNDAVQFCNKLSELSGRDSVYTSANGEWSAQFERNGYRLPTEAEWEFACTGGGSEMFFLPLDQFAWYSANSHGSTHNVGEKQPTSLGLYDMLGNVSEWCHDKNNRSRTVSSSEVFGGPATGFERVTRGGSWREMVSNLTPKHRDPLNPGTRSETVGFRIVRRA